MKSTGTLFQSDMVRALLRHIDPKTQTRRIIDPQPQHHPVFCTPETTIGCKEPGWFDADGINPGTPIPCRFGGAGDELWVKETFARQDRMLFFKADATSVSGDWWNTHPELLKGIEEMNPGTIEEHCTPKPYETPPDKWTPSIFCTRSVSRITLTIDNIRAQRLQEITEQDAIAEGIERNRIFPDKWRRYDDKHDAFAETAKLSYRTLWNSINAKPQPVYIRDASGNKYINHYIAYPWELGDMHAIKGVTDVRDNRALKYGSASYRHKAVFIYPNPYVWAITFHRKP